MNSLYDERMRRIIENSSDAPHDVLRQEKKMEIIHQYFSRMKKKRRLVIVMGGTLDNPTYKDVCTDTTGHAEVVQVEYDSNQITYQELLTLFWQNHDPTSLNRQGADTGTQYRSVIFYHTDEQKQAAEASKMALEASKAYKLPIVTLIVPASVFWRAEEYHQNYLAKRGQNGCAI